MLLKMFKNSLLVVGALMNFASLTAAPLITQFTTSGDSDEIVVAADNSNNAIAVLIDGDEVRASYLTNGGPWGPLVTLSTTTAVDYEGVSVAMDATGTALAAWIDDTNNLVETAYFSGGSWSTPTPAPLDSTTNEFDTTSVAMDGLGKGLAVWSELDIRASFFSGGTWTPFVNIGTGVYSNNITASYSPNGSASAVWGHFDFGVNDIYANTYNGTTWQGLINLDTDPTQNPDAGIDDLGNTIAIWSSGTGLSNIVTRRFNGVTWSPAQTISAAPGNLGRPRIAVAFDGTAVAVWTDAGNNIQMSLFNGTTWSAPIFVVGASQEPRVTMDDSGNALIGWVTLGNDLYYARLPKGSSTLDSVTFIRTAPPIADDIDVLDLALSNASSIGFAVWAEQNEVASDTFGTFSLFAPLVSPPLGIFGSTCNNKFASQSDRVNTIVFVPSVDPDVVVYQISRNGVLIATVLSSGPYTYFDHNRCKGVPDTYTVVAVDGAGNVSSPVTITIVP